MTVAIDRTKGDQSTPGNIIRGEGYALIRNSEATPDPDKVIHIPCADSFPSSCSCAISIPIVSGMETNWFSMADIHGKVSPSPILAMK